MITTPEIICDLFSFLDKDQIERIQLVSQFWNNVIIRHKNILPLRQFDRLDWDYDEINFVTKDYPREHFSYKMEFDGTNLSKSEENVLSRYSQLTVDEVLANLNDVVFGSIYIDDNDSEERLDSEGRWDSLLNMIKLVTTKTGSRFRGRYGSCDMGFSSQLNEVFDNYIIVDELNPCYSYRCDSYIREVCANPEIVQLPSTPKEIRLFCLEFEENEELLHFTCNGKLNGANRLTIEFETSNYGNFIWQWFELYRTHQNPISLVGKFEFDNLPSTPNEFNDIILDTLKTFLNNTQLRVKYSLERKESHSPFYIGDYVKRNCVLHETDSYALVIEMVYRGVTDMSSINASDLDQPPCKKMRMISLCVKSL